MRRGPATGRAPGLPPGWMRGDDLATQGWGMAASWNVLGRLWRTLTRFGVGPRVLKTALAAGLAWWIGNLLGEPQPVFAAIAAIIGLEPTVASSLARAGELLL